MTHTSFGQHIRILRREQHMSQRDLATRIGVDFTYLSKIETGDMAAPSEEVIWLIASALAADELDLLDRAGKVPKTLKPMLMDNPLAAHLLRLLSKRKLSDEVYRQMIALAESEPAP